MLPVNSPRWNGEDLHGRSILLASEQGLGDTLQFIRFASAGQRTGGPCDLRLPRTAGSVVGSLPGRRPRCRVAVTLPDVDVHVPLLSVPAIMGTTLANIPDRPYLAVDAATIQKWRPIVDRAVDAHDRPPTAFAAVPRARPFTIGIAWQGNAGNNTDRSRSFPLCSFRLPGRHSGRPSAESSERSRDRTDRRLERPVRRGPTVRRGPRRRRLSRLSWIQRP